MMDERQKDLELWKAWKQAPTPMNLEALMKQVAPILRRETLAWSSTAPAFLLENEAKRIAVEAFQSYDPSAGAMLSTHLVNRLKKLSRIGYQNQSTLSVPEHMRLTYHKYLNAQTHLTELNNGVKPSMHEVADHMGIAPKRLIKLVETVGKRELTESGDGTEFATSIPDDVLDLAYADMTQVQKDIFRYRTGYDGTKVLNANQIIKKMGITQGQLSYQILQIKALLQRAQQLR